MTAQVFRNGQAPTFYIGDILSPAPGGGVDGSFQNLNVAKSSVLGASATVGRALLVHQTVPGTSPIETRGSVNGIANGLIVTQTGFPGGPELAAFGANTAEPAPAAYAYGYNGVDLRLGAGNVELLRLKFSGIALNTAASDVLALVPGNTTIFKNTLASGGSTPIWTPLAGWSGPPTTNRLSWQRIGNVVDCSGVFLGASTLVGLNTASFTLPVPRTSGPFTGLAGEVLGTVVWRTTTGLVNSGDVVGTIGSTTTVTVSVTQTPPANPGTLQVSFKYTV